MALMDMAINGIKVDEKINTYRGLQSSWRKSPSWFSRAREKGQCSHLEYSIATMMMVWYGGGDGHQDGEGSITRYDDRVRRHAAGPSVPINIVKSLTMMDDDDISQQSN